VKSYIVREKMTAPMLATWADAVDLVNRVSSEWGNELRCHELARAAHQVLYQLKRTTRVVDGRLFGIEHSWLSLGSESGLGSGPILDVYCPGRVPQVQLIDNHWAVARGYEPGKDRRDINQVIIAKLIEEMSRAA
jgi:hypothetical protein